MIQNVLSDIGVVGLYGVISIILFILVFGAVLVRAFLLKKSHLDAMGSLPLQDDNSAAQHKGDNPHE